jgi:hypothetical protein
MRRSLSVDALGAEAAQIGSNMWKHRSVSREMASV